MSKELCDYLYYFAVLLYLFRNKGTGINIQDLKHGLSQTYTVTTQYPCYFFVLSPIISNSLFAFLTTVEP